MADNIINKVDIGGVLYDIQDITSGYSQIEIDHLLSSGIAIGNITIDGHTYIIYAPNDSGDQGGLNVDVNTNNTNLLLING